MARIVNLRQPKEDQDLQAIQEPTLVAHHTSTVHATHPAERLSHLHEHHQSSQDEARHNPAPYPSADILVWEGPLSGHIPHMRVVTSVLVILVAFSLWSFARQDLIGSLLFILLAGALFHHIRRDKEIVDFEVNLQGVRVDHKIYHYRDIESFWINYHPHIGVRQLSLHLKKKHALLVKIPLHDQDPVQVRDIMIDFIPEIPHHDSLADTLSRRLGF
jgi:hypothetical protein